MTLTTDTLREEIRTLAREELHLKEELPEDISSELDSMQRLSLVVAIEDRYEICFDPEDEQVTLTLDDVVALVHRKLTEPAADER
ncbi:MAG: acyl carrier protein [Myxococcota bacterium]|jgi:acyl carrier protein